MERNEQEIHRICKALRKQVDWNSKDSSSEKMSNYDKTSITKTPN